MRPVTDARLFIVTDGNPDGSGDEEVGGDPNDGVPFDTPEPELAQILPQ